MIESVLRSGYFTRTRTVLEQRPNVNAQQVRKSAVVVAAGCDIVALPFNLAVGTVRFSNLMDGLHYQPVHPIERGALGLVSVGVARVGTYSGAGAGLLLGALTVPLAVAVGTKANAWMMKGAVWGAKVGALIASVPALMIEAVRSGLRYTLDHPVAVIIFAALVLLQWTTELSAAAALEAAGLNRQVAQITAAAVVTYMFCSVHVDAKGRPYRVPSLLVPGL